MILPSALPGQGSAPNSGGQQQSSGHSKRVVHRAWYRKTRSDSCSVASKLDSYILLINLILSWLEGGAFADFVSTAAKSQPRPFCILMQGALSSFGILHSQVSFSFSLQFWFETIVLVVVVVIVVGGGGRGRSVDHQDAKRKQRQGMGHGCALARTACQNLLLEAHKLYSSLGVVGRRGQGGCATRRPSDWARVPFAATRPHIAACLTFMLPVSTCSSCSNGFIMCGMMLEDAGHILWNLNCD